MTKYFDAIAQAKDAVVSVLTKKGVQSRYLAFGGEGEEPSRKVRVPTDVRSEFLANRAMGDWAEQLLSEAIQEAYSDWATTHYGNTDSTVAGDQGFAELYLQGIEEVRLYGKRPDLLILPKELNIPADISSYPLDESDPIVSRSYAAVEVRSSKLIAHQYMKVRREEAALGKKSGRMSPSFTVKVEDLVIVYRWLERHKIPQAYFQVFLDSIWAINVLQIFRLIGSGTGFTIEKPEKSQQKATIMIPITQGIQVASFTERPTFEAATQINRLGRLFAYVKPVGGRIEVNRQAIKTTLLEGT